MKKLDTTLRVLDARSHSLNHKCSLKINQVTPIDGNHKLIRNPTTRSLLPALSENGVINPHCQYIRRWDVVMALLLVYTAIVTPFETSFLSTKFDFLYVVNRVGTCHALFSNFFYNN